MDAEEQDGRRRLHVHVGAQGDHVHHGCMSLQRDNVSYYDQFSEGYEDRRHGGYHRFLDDEQAALVLRHAAPAHRVLEIGCGTGLIMQRLAPRVAEVVGIDLSPGMLSKARAKGLSVHEASATSLPFEDESFDVACSFKVLPHVLEIATALSECRRVLRAGGVALLEFYNPASLRHLRKRLFAGRIAPGVTEAEVFTRFDGLAEASLLLEQAGLQVEGHHGLVIVSPAAIAHDLPMAGGLLRWLERAAAGSPLRHYGGFLTLVGRRR